jgi:DNA-directed RNA polymerase subunit M/transcription elongation factor TFIIS
MTIALSCRGCGQALKVKDELAGRKVKCPKCGSVIAVLGAKADGDARITAKVPRSRVQEDEDEDEEPEEYERPQKKKKKAKSNRGLLIGAAVAGVILIAVVVVVLLSWERTTQTKVAQKRIQQPPVDPQRVNVPPVAEEPQPEKKAPVGGIGRVMEVTVAQNALRQLGIAYRNFEALENRGPKNQKELSPFYENNNEINEALTKKWITFIWGVPRSNLAENGASNTVLAYETDHDRQGVRMVLFGDGSVRGLSDEDFNNAPRAKGKGN